MRIIFFFSFFFFLPPFSSSFSLSLTFSPLHRLLSSLSSTYCSSKKDFVWTNVGIFSCPADNPRAGELTETSPSCRLFCRYGKVISLRPLLCTTSFFAINMPPILLFFFKSVTGGTFLEKGLIECTRKPLELSTAFRLSFPLSL